MLDFICMGPVQLPEAWNKQKVQNEKLLSTLGFEAMPCLLVHLQISIVMNDDFTVHYKSLCSTIRK